MNLFPSQFHALNFATKVSDALEHHGILPETIELEVTEDITLADDERSLRIVNEIRSLGVGIAFDDFGTGYASLSSLQRFPMTTLKIDRSFIREIQSRPGDAAIARALIAMSRDLGLETIAEGIETKEQEAALQRMGCQSGQGYLYARPLPESELQTYIDAPRALRTA